MFWKHKRIPPGQIIVAGFGGTILLGTLLLMLPFAARSGESTGFMDAFFTATSATCVTGLVVFDTYSHWTVFGQAVILALIQIGGMGVVTMAIAISIFTGKRIGLKQRFLMQESISAPQVGGIIRLTSFILKMILLIEGVGALLLSIRFIPQMGFARGIWNAVFHSVSSFCNAGFDLMGKNSPYSSLTGYESDPIVNLTVMGLIIIGGLGFFVWDDFRQNKLNIRAYRLHTKLVLVTTVILLALPAIYFFFAEFGRPEWKFSSGGERLWASLFQTVTPRTAGFNTVDLTRLLQPSVLLIILLMLVGGSPSSTAGGFKTTTLAALFLCIRSVFRNQDSIRCFGRRFPPEVLRHAATLFSLYLFLFLAGGAAISYTENIPMLTALFETASAIGTVGLSLGITPELGVFSHCILAFLMFFGRVGGLTLIYAMSGAHTPAPSQVPQEKITIG